MTSNNFESQLLSELKKQNKLLSIIAEAFIIKESENGLSYYGQEGALLREISEIIGKDN